MILGIGCDLVRTARFQEILARNPQRLKRLCDRILHRAERDGIGSASDPKTIQRLSSAWAAKEALYKSLSPEDQTDCRFNEWRKYWNGVQYELVSDHNRIDQVLLTISHDGDYTMAMAVRQLRN